MNRGNLVKISAQSNALDGESTAAGIKGERIDLSEIRFTTDI